MNEKEVKDLLKSIGSLSEICRVFYEENIRVGFDEDQSIELTESLLKNFINICNGGISNGS